MANSSSVEALRASLQDKDAEVRAIATRSLGQLRATQAVADLQTMQRSETDLAVLAEIQAALTRIDAATFDPSAEASTAAALFDRDQLGRAFKV